MTATKPIPTGACPPFDASGWRVREQIVRIDEPFVQDHVHRIFRVPIRFGQHVTENQKLIDAAAQRRPIAAPR